MEPAFLILLALVFVPLIWFIGNYNGLVGLRNHCQESWSGIDTELKRRHNLIPNLVETVRGYAAHEERVLKLVMEARAQAREEAEGNASPSRLAEDENRLVSSLGGLFAVAEDYPDLKADRHFLQLQKELVNTEDRIQSARRFYNANVRDLNNRIEMFPSSIVAGMFGFQKAEYFELDEFSHRLPPEVNLT